MNYYKAFNDTFSCICKEREKRPIQGPDYQNSGWILYEREQMYQKVNALRAELGKLPITMKDFIKAEQMATGHVDYQHKFCLYCCNLVQDTFI